MTAALVFGAGGTPAWAFHLGVARAVESELGVTARSAELVVGTSAGAAVGAAMRLGASVDEILTSVTTPPTEEERARIRAEAGSARAGITRFLPLSPTLAVRGLLNPRRAGLVMAGALPGGFLPTMGLSRMPRIAEATSWPSGLYLTSVQVRGGDRIVFGRDRTDVSVADAVEASSAVPGMFRPKVIDGQQFVDGATASSNHADLAGDVRPDIVVISSVQTRPGLRASRILARRQLPAEVRRLEDAGARVVVVEPDAAIADAIAGFPRSTGDRGPEIVERVTKHATSVLTQC